MKGKLIGIGVLVLVLALLVTLVPGCGGGGEKPPTGTTPTPGVTPPKATPTPQTKTVKVGVLAPLSGPAAPWGLDLVRGVEWAAARANDKGGVKVGNDTYTIKVTSYDAGLIPSTAETAASRAVYEDGVKWVVGPILELTAQAVMPLLTQNKIVHNVVVNPIPLGPDTPYTFTSGGGCPDAWQDGFYDFVMERYPQVKTVALIFSPGNESHGEGSKLAIERRGLELVGLQGAYTYGTTDFYPQLIPLISKNPDLLDLGCAPPGDAALQIKQARELGYKGLIMANCIGGASNVVVDIAGLQAAEGVIANGTNYLSDAVPSESRAIYQDYVARYHPEGGRLGTVVEIGYTNMNLYIKGWQEVGSLDPDAFVARVTQPGYTFDNVGWTSQLGGQETMGLKRHVPVIQAYDIIQNGQLNTLQAGPLDCP